MNRAHALFAAVAPALLALAACVPSGSPPTPASTVRRPSLTRASQIRNALPAPARASSLVETHGDLESPIAVRWVVSRAPYEDRTLAGAPRTRVVLVAEVTRNGVLDLPLAVTVRVPDGATLVRGALQRSVPVAPPGTVDRAEIELSYEHAPPLGDVVLEVDAQSPYAGYHASVPYRFGRPPAHTTPQPPRGAPLVVNGVDWGAPIELTRPRE